MKKGANRNKYQSNLVLPTPLPVNIGVDVLLAMAARVHVETALTISKIHQAYLEPSRQKRPRVGPFINKFILLKYIKTVIQ